MNPRKPACSATQHELLLDRPALAQEEPWRVLRIFGDFVEGFETLAGLARAGFAVITVVAHIQRCHSRAGGSRGPGA